MAEAPAVDETPAEATSLSSNEATATGPTTTTSAAEPSHQVKDPKRQRIYLSMPKWMTRMSFSTKEREQNPPQQTQPALGQTPPQKSQPEKAPPLETIPSQETPQQQTPPQKTQPEQTPPQQTLPEKKSQKTPPQVPRDGDWLLGHSLDSMKEGYIRRNQFMTVKGEDWFFGHTSTEEAEKLLRIHNVRGAFLIRLSDTRPGDHVLSVWDGKKVRHYHIRHLHKGTFFIEDHVVFNSLKELVNYYSEEARGLCARLVNDHTKDVFEISRKSVAFTSKLSDGQFFEAFEGLWKGTIPVAIKSFKPGTIQAERFLQEASVMKKVCHPKLVQVYAVCTLDEPFLFITELISQGSLLEYLRRGDRETLPLSQLINMGAQVAAGMAYLETENYIHGNLAAKNVMVGENNTCKVANFEMAHLINDKESAKYMPGFKWMAPEAALYGRFSIKSDVWSFGMLLFELVTYGQTPYPRMSNSLVLQLLERGYCMPCPPNTPNSLYQLMQGTWKKNPMERLTFDFLQSVLEDFSCWNDNIS